MHKTILFSLLTATLACAPAYSSTLYDEATSGDLSNNGLAPTALTFAAGSNVVTGTTGRAATVDRDYFTITVPTGFAISQIIELAGTQAGGVSFFGIEAGPQLTLPTTATTAAGLLGWDHYAAVSADTDLLPAISVATLGSSGFTTLGPGQYSLWIQDFTAGTYNYAFDIELAQTPEPATYAVSLGALALVGLGVGRRGKNKLR